jgi:hypothetical protein
MVLMVDPAVLSRRFERISKTLYHGTGSRQYSSLLQGVNISRCNPCTDFGQGFYLTSDFHQASKHAEKRCFKNAHPIVFEYEVNLSELRKYDSKTWVVMDKNWARFIYQNRSTLNHIMHSYDYVIGGVADGQLEDLIELMDNGNISIEIFYENIAKYGTYDQIWCIIK